MKRLFSTAFAVIFVFFINNFAQIPTNTLVQIVKAEDERRFDATLENLLKSPNVKVRERAVLAIGKIGEENSISALEQLSATEKDDDVRTMIMFALGEIESAKGAKMILKTLQTRNESPKVLARAIEAAGKIAAANPKDENSKTLGAAIVEKLDFENKKRSAAFENVVLLGITAVLRARPEGGEKVVAEFLSYSNPRIRADALNTLARLRSKIANEKTRELLKNDKDAVVRANAARLLGVAEDKEALDLLLNAATKDSDSRVRVSAIRALANLKDTSVAEKLIPTLMVVDFGKGAFLGSLRFTGESQISQDKSEYLEIATTLSRLLPNTNNQKAIEFLEKVRKFDKYESPETEIAYALISPKGYLGAVPKSENTNKNFWRQIIATSQGFAQFAKLEDKGKSLSATEPPEYVLSIFLQITTEDIGDDLIKAAPDVLRAYSQFKTNDLGKILLQNLKHKDVQLRATAAGILGEQPSSKENIEALKKAFSSAFVTDKRDNDAQLAILDALFKLDKNESVGILLTALDATDYLVRKRAFQLLKTEGLEKDFPGLPTTLENFVKNKKNQVLPYSTASSTKLGQVLNTNADYIRAVSRKNGIVKAVFTTSKGNFTIDLTPEDAPLTVDNFIKLAKSNYFNGVSVHRVVPNFVMQDGDPRGDGNGGPGWSIRCEINMLEYGRGAVGMALSGKDTGGSQWFVTHSPQPHLDGGYTVFGRVNENDMKTVDAIVRGDKIISVKIIGDSIPRGAKKNK